MWCTRWFLPLLLLPIPAARPGFLFAFAVSLFLHAKPCFYCMVLLAALFTSTCYWQPLPIDTPLSFPSGNVSTYRDVMLSNLSASSTLTSPASGSEETVMEEISRRLPQFVQLLDRCWCDTSKLDLAEWETKSALASLREFEDGLRRKEKLKQKELDRREAGKVLPSGTGGAATPPQESPSTASAESTATAEAVDSYIEQEHFSFRRLRNLVFPTSSTTAKYKLVPPTTPESSPFVSSELDSTPVSQVAVLDVKPPDPYNTTVDAAPSSPSPHVDSPRHQEEFRLFGKYYDFRPYGLDMTIDFRWG